MAVGAWNERFLSNFDCLYLANAGTSWSADYTIIIIIIIIIIISKLFNNGNPSAEAAFQGAVLKIIYKLTY